MSTAASTSDILRAVERASTALGIQAFHGNTAPPGWRVSIPRPGAGATACVVINHPDGRFWSASPPIALAFCLLLASGSEPVDVGRCPACEGRGHRPHALAIAPDALGRTPGQRRQGERVGRVLVSTTYWPDGGATVHSNAPCPACTGTGRELVPVERLLLDAAEPCQTCKDTGTMPDGEDFAACPDCPARQALLARADKLQAAANPLGDLLAWALRLWAGEPTDCGPCLPCGGCGLIYKRHSGLVLSVGCPDCGGTDNTSGSGRLFGHPHTAEAVAQLTAAWERLTVPCGNCTRSDWAGVREHCVQCGGHGRVKPDTTAGAYSIRVGDHVYTATSDGSRTAREIADDLSAQGAPCTVSVGEDGTLLVTISGNEESTVWTSTIAGTADVEAVEPVRRRQRPHARHIGDQLGRRLGVARR